MTGFCNHASAPGVQQAPAPSATILQNPGGCCRAPWQQTSLTCQTDSLCVTSDTWKNDFKPPTWSQGPVHEPTVQAWLLFSEWTWHMKLLLLINIPTTAGRSEEEGLTCNTEERQTKKIRYICTCSGSARSGARQAFASELQHLCNATTPSFHLLFLAVLCLLKQNRQEAFAGNIKQALADWIRCKKICQRGEKKNTKAIWSSCQPGFISVMARKAERKQSSNWQVRVQCLYPRFVFYPPPSSFHPFLLYQTDWSPIWFGSSGYIQSASGPADV